MKKIRLLSLNVSIFDPNNDKIVAFLKGINPDIGCFQEATRKVDDSADEAFITKDAIDKGLPNLKCSFYTPNWVLKDFRQKNFHGRKIFQHDFGGLIEYGNYLKSRYEITEGKGVYLQKDFSYITNWEEFARHPGEEPRMVQVADIKVHDRTKLRILNYHGIWSKHKKDTERTIRACQKILALAKEVNYPVVISGDFNLLPQTKSIGVLKSNFRNLVDEFNITHTRPKSNELSGLQRNVVDYIFVSRGIVVNNFKVMDTNVSDHLPLLLDFVIE